MSQAIPLISELIYKHLRGELTIEENITLQQWKEANDDNRAMFEALVKKEAIEERLKAYHEATESKARIRQKLEADLFSSPAALHRVHFLKRVWFRYAAAILIIAGAGIYFSSSNEVAPKTISTPVVVAPVADVMPGSDKAVLTLSDGKKISLGNTSETIKDGNISIKSSNGGLLYSHAAVSAINTMTTPRGGQFKLTLADGTQVWLNASSSITYPTAFTGNTRNVSITGEAYFEVAKRKDMPFHVKTPKEEIVVLGTHFNVNTYADESSIKTSLLEGAVMVDNKILSPGQAYTDGQVVATDVEQDVAWKNGVFNFNNVTVQQAMRQLARWYDIKIVYDEPVEGAFVGEIGRGLTLTQVLKGLDGVGVHFKLENSILHVFP